MTEAVPVTPRPPDGLGVDCRRVEAKLHHGVLIVRVGTPAYR